MLSQLSIQSRTIYLGNGAAQCPEPFCVNLNGNTEGGVSRGQSLTGGSLHLVLLVSLGEGMVHLIPQQRS